jgi:putative hydrolase of the HAD superfamily
MKSCVVKVIFFDYGGVIADEGFKYGLDAIARLNGIDPEFFFNTLYSVINLMPSKVT